MIRTMKMVTAACIAALALSCAQARYARTSVEQAVDNPVTQSYDWGEVHCYQGTVCAEIEVLRVDIEERDGGRIEVVLHNRTGESVAGQIAIQVLDQNGAKLDESNYQDIALPPRQETSWDMPGIFRTGASIRILLRARGA